MSYTSIIVHGFSKTYTQFGGSAIFSCVADLLTVRLAGYGSAIREIRIVAYLRSLKRDPWSGLDEKMRDELVLIQNSIPDHDPNAGFDELFENFNAYLTQLPTVKFHRKLMRAEIAYASKQFTAEDDAGWHPSAYNCNRAMSEILESLQLLKKRITRSDDFDIGQFLADAAQILTTNIESVDEWLRIREQAGAIERARNAAKSAWDLLEIDWDRFHPAARAILDDPLYWDPADDFAPHGNDTGADILEDYLAWEKRNKRHGQKSPLNFMENEMKKWRVASIDWLVEDAPTVRALSKEKPIEMALCNDAAIALAFAVLKSRAECPTDTIRVALAAIKRRMILAKDLIPDYAVRKKWQAALTKMKAKLESLARTG